MAVDNHVFVALGGHAVSLGAHRELVKSHDTDDLGPELVVGAGRTRGRVPVHVNAMLGGSGVLTLVVRGEVESIIPAIAALGGDLLAVGTDMTVALLSVTERRIRHTIKLSTPFRGFLPLAAGGLVIIEEGGVRRLLPDGHVAWTANTDLIDRVALQGEVLVVEHFDAPPITLRLDDGVASVIL